MPFFYCRGTLAVALLRATTGSICLRFGLVDGDGTATDFCAMQTSDGLFGITIDRHFNKTKPL